MRSQLHFINDHRSIHPTEKAGRVIPCRGQDRRIIKGDISRRVLYLGDLPDQGTLARLTRSIQKDDRSVLKCSQKLSSNRSLIDFLRVIFEWMKINHIVVDFHPHRWRKKVICRTRSLHNATTLTAQSFRVRSGFAPVLIHSVDWVTLTPLNYQNTATGWQRGSGTNGVNCPDYT